MTVLPMTEMQRLVTAMRQGWPTVCALAMMPLPIDLLDALRPRRSLLVSLPDGRRVLQCELTLDEASALVPLVAEVLQAEPPQPARVLRLEA